MGISSPIILSFNIHISMVNGILIIHINSRTSTNIFPIFLRFSINPSSLLVTGFHIVQISLNSTEYNESCYITGHHIEIVRLSFSQQITGRCRFRIIFTINLGRTWKLIMFNQHILQYTYLSRSLHKQTPTPVTIYFSIGYVVVAFIITASSIVRKTILH